MESRGVEEPESGSVPPHEALVKQQLDEWLDLALADTFPASDPIASAPSDPALLASDQNNPPDRPRQGTPDAN
jgi:hypothetical protein